MINKTTISITCNQHSFAGVIGFHFCDGLWFKIKNGLLHHYSLDPDAFKIYTIIVLCGKYVYLKLPMGIIGSPDIFQAKIMELMATLEFLQAYIDDLLCITKGSLG